MPAGGVFGTGATDLFCSGVAKGSKGLALLLRNPARDAARRSRAILGLIVFAVVRATWRPVAPLRIARRRTWGQILSTSARMYVQRPRLFLGLGLILIPITIATTILQWLVLQLRRPPRRRHGPGRRRVRAPRARDRDDARPCSGSGSSRRRRHVRSSRSTPAGRSGRSTPTGSRSRRLRPLLRTVALFVVPWIALTATAFLIPVAIWLAVRWCLLAPAVELEGEVGLSGAAPQRRASSASLDPRRLARRRQRRVALAAGPLLGVALIFLTNMPRSRS